LLVKIWWIQECRIWT